MILQRFAAVAMPAAAALAAPSAAALAQTAPSPAPVIARTIEQIVPVDAAVIGRLPSIEVRVSMLTGRGPQEATFSGVLLWSVLQGQGVVADDPKERLRRTLIVTGRDGWTAALALAEVDPEFEGKQVILATPRDGKPLDNELRLVVPGDKRGGRSARDVVRGACGTWFA